MKNSKLRKIIRESIEQMLNEKEPCGPGTPGYECFMNGNQTCKSARCCGSCDKVEANDGQDQAIFCDCMGAIGLGKTGPSTDKAFESLITEKDKGFDCKCEDANGNIVGFCKSHSTKGGRGCGCCKRLFSVKIPN